jgi:hypothetical protein
MRFGLILDKAPLVVIECPDGYEYRPEGLFPHIGNATEDVYFDEVFDRARKAKKGFRIVYEPTFNGRTFMVTGGMGFRESPTVPKTREELHPGQDMGQLPGQANPDRVDLYQRIRADLCSARTYARADGGVGDSEAARTLAMTVQSYLREQRDVYGKWVEVADRIKRLPNTLDVVEGLKDALKLAKRSLPVRSKY